MTSARRSLPRALGVAFGIAVGVGSMIGAGILRAPADVAARVPSPILFLVVWIVGGAYALLGGNIVSELGTMMPSSGGQYVFARRAFGPYVGFVVGWNDWLSTCGSIAAVAIAFAESVRALVGVGSVSIVAVVAVSVVLAITLAGIRAGDRAQRVTSAVKALALLALVVACVLFRRPGGAPGAAPNGVTSIGAFVLALQGVIYAYDGWTGPIYVTGELRDPGREVPRAIFGGIVSVMLLYLAVNAAFVAVLPIDAIGRSTLVASDVARALFGAGGASLVHVLVVLVLPSAIVANVLLASRVPYAMARDGVAPASLAHVSRADVPAAGMLVSGLAAVLLAATGTFSQVINLCAYLFVASYVITFVALFVLRRREPLASRPYRAWGHPWTTALAVLASSTFLVGVLVADPRGAMLSLACLAITPPLYLALRRTPGTRTIPELPQPEA